MDKELLATLNSMPDRFVLDKPYQIVALFLEAKPHFQQYDIIKLWEQDIDGLSNSPTYRPSESFAALSECVFHTLLQGKIPTKQMLKEAFVDYIDTIIYYVEPLIKKEVAELVVPEPEIVEEIPPEYPEQLTMLEAFDQALDNERIFTSFKQGYNIVRDTVSSKKSFNEHEDGVLRSELIDPKGNLTGKAELRFDTIDLPKGDEATLWLDLVQSTINAFDELTADLLDIISHMWLVQEKDEDGYINFHSDEVLRLRHGNMEGKPLIIRERDRFKIMKRVAALSSIWLSMREGEDNVKVVDRASIKEDEEYDFTTFHRMFDINSVKVAYDKKTGEPRGIYELKVKPAPILRSYFDATLRTFVPIDLKIIQYSYNNQRELKRLGRYLSYQWKIRTVSRTLNQPFKVKTLLDAIDFPTSYNGVTIRERLEQTLNELMKDKIIEDWYYKEPVDEERVGKRDWVRKYWGELNIMINPPKETVEINKQKFLQHVNLPTKDKTKVLLLQDTGEYTKLEETPQLNENTPISPESVGLLIEELKLSIRSAATEIGISHSTLIRYVSNEAKRSNKSVLGKLEKWFREKVKNI